MQTTKRAWSCQWQLPSEACDSLTMRPSDPWHCARRCNWSSDEKDTARLANGWCRGRHVPATSDTMLLSSTQPSVSCLPRCTLEGTDLTSCFLLSVVSSSPVALVKFFPFAASALPRLPRYGIRCMFRDVVSLLSSPPNPPSGSSRSRLLARVPISSQRSGAQSVSQGCGQLNHCHLVPLERSHGRIRTSSFSNPRITARRAST